MTKKIRGALVLFLGVVLFAALMTAPAASSTTPSQAKSVAIQVAASDSAHYVTKTESRAEAAQRASRAWRAKLYPKLHRASPTRSKNYAKFYIKYKYKWSYSQYQCLVKLWEKESGWRYNSYDPGQGGAMAGGVRKTWGIPQANPGTKMRSAGSDWRTNTATQIRWGAGYIKGRYGSACNAWSYWLDHRYY